MRLSGPILALASALVGLAMGALLFAPGWSSAPEAAGPCGRDPHPAPDGDGCVPRDEACRAELRGVASETAQCEARSEEGRGLIRIALDGSGDVRLALIDGAGTRVLSRTLQLGGTLAQDIDAAGRPGLWTLRVTADDAGIVGEAWMWG